MGWQKSAIVRLLEFYANAYQGKKKKDPFMTYVRGKEIWFNEDMINELLGTLLPLICRK